MMNRLFLALIGTLSMLSAAPVNIQGTPCISVGNPPGCEGLGFFTGTLDYSFSSATAGTLQVNLTNSASTSAGGRLVAFVFNNPGNLITGVNLTAAPSAAWDEIGGTTFQNSISASPMGDFDIGASVTGEFLGGGSPNPGYLPGNSGSFTFSLTAASGLNTLTTQSFISALNTTGDFFAVRFRGFNNDGSDKVRGTLSPVPEPQFLVLLSGGIAALLVINVRRRKAQPQA